MWRLLVLLVAAAAGLQVAAGDTPALLQNQTEANLTRVTVSTVGGDLVSTVAAGAAIRFVVGKEPPVTTADFARAVAVNASVAALQNGLLDNAALIEGLAAKLDASVTMLQETMSENDAALQRTLREKDIALQEALEGRDALITELAGRLAQATSLLNTAVSRVEALEAMVPSDSEVVAIYRRDFGPSSAGWSYQYNGGELTDPSRYVDLVFG